MAKEGYQTITVDDETYSLVKQVSQSINRTVAYAVRFVFSGGQVIHGVMFRPEQICVECGYHPPHVVEFNKSIATGNCPLCKGQIITRYIKTRNQAPISWEGRPRIGAPYIETSDQSSVARAESGS